MSDTITQTRLGMRLDNYLREYTVKHGEKASHSKAEWERVWQIADVARAGKRLTPELVDEVCIALNTF